LGAEEARNRTGHDWVEPKLPKEPTTRGTNYAVEYQRYLEHKRTYTEYTRILAALRTQILDAIDEAYLADIPSADAEYGMDSLPPKVILDYVCTKYGRLTNAEYEANKRMLLEVADPTKSIAEMFLRVRDICNTAQLGGPNQRITEETKVHHVRESLLNTGAYAHMITTWDDKGHTVTETEGSWTRFVDHIYMQEELRLRNATARSEGFANKATTSTPPKRPTTGNSVGHENNKRAKTTPPNEDGRNILNGRVVGYCWTHGLTYGSHHTTRTCRQPATGHPTDTSGAKRGSAAASSRIAGNIIKDLLQDE
jgi:hypothetical protein